MKKTRMLVAAVAAVAGLVAFAGPAQADPPNAVPGTSFPDPLPASINPNGSNNPDGFCPFPVHVDYLSNQIAHRSTTNPDGSTSTRFTGWATAIVTNLTTKKALKFKVSGPGTFTSFPDGAFNLNLRLSALESQGQVRILSSPRITTMDNIEASIQQGVAIPISVVSAAGVNTVFVDAKLDLTVKPHVTNEGTVMIMVNVTRNEPDFVNTGARGDPTILKKEAKTTMLIRDGDTAVIGGIYTRNSGLSYAKVPFFADIPVLGVMFRNRRENDDRTEFLVFITPRIANRARALGQ